MTLGEAMVSKSTQTSTFGRIFAEAWLRDKEQFRKNLRISTETYQTLIPYFNCYNLIWHMLKKFFNILNFFILLK